VSVIELFDYFELDKYFVLHDEVGTIVSDHDTIIPNFDELLLDYFNSTFAKFVAKSIFIHFF